MKALKKLITLIKGSANDAAEAVVNANSVAILREKIREAEGHHEKAFDSLTSLIADLKIAENKMGKVQADLDKQTAALKAVMGKKAKPKKAVLEMKAQQIADLRNDLNADQELVATLTTSVKEMRAYESKMKRRIKQLKSSLQQVEVNERLNAAHKATMQVVGSGKAMGAGICMDEVKERQERERLAMDAAEELEGVSEGELVTADSILAELEKEEG